MYIHIHVANWIKCYNVYKEGKSVSNVVYTVCKMYVESHMLGMWQLTNHNTATYKYLVCLCLNFAVSRNENEAGQGAGTYLAVGLTQCFTKCSQ